MTHSNPRNGEFYVVLPADSTYGYVIKKDGYASISDNVKPFDPNRTGMDTIRLYTIEEIKKGNVHIALNNIFFETDKFDLKSESFSELDRWGAFILENNLSVEIEGYTDDAGSPEYNLKLSSNRANAAREYLIKKGVPNERISIIGYGETKPIASNKTEEGKAKNRRIEMRFK